MASAEGPLRNGLVRYWALGEMIGGVIEAQILLGCLDICWLTLMLSHTWSGFHLATVTAIHGMNFIIQAF